MQWPRRLAGKAIPMRRSLSDSIDMFSAAHNSFAEVVALFSPLLVASRFFSFSVVFPFGEQTVKVQLLEGRIRAGKNVRRTSCEPECRLARRTGGGRDRRNGPQIDIMREIDFRACLRAIAGLQHLSIRVRSECGGDADGMRTL